VLEVILRALLLILDGAPMSARTARAPAWLHWLTCAVEESESNPSPDAFEVTVDGIQFSVVYDSNQPGTYHYTRRSHPAYGYGFTSRRSDHQRSTTARHIDAIRNFLGICDPVTGYIEDDPDDDGSDDVADD
jgi:hypothetical protein